MNKKVMTFVLNTVEYDKLLEATSRLNISYSDFFRLGLWMALAEYKDSEDVTPLKDVVEEVVDSILKARGM
jgi:hypothetical protein